MSTLLIAIPVWAGIALSAIVMARIGRWIDAMIPPFREADIVPYALLAIVMACAVGVAVLLYASF